LRFAKLVWRDTAIFPGRCDIGDKLIQIYAEALVEIGHGRALVNRRENETGGEKDGKAQQRGGKEKPFHD
jgi:hypothetical protein